jgi:hypothetical protein
METLKNLLNGMEVPFPFGFVVVMAIVLYFIGNRGLKDPCVDNKKIPIRNVFIGVIASAVWMGVNYVNSFGFILTATLIQYVVVAAICGVLTAGAPTLLHEILKNKAKSLIETLKNEGDNTNA